MTLVMHPLFILFFFLVKKIWSGWDSIVMDNYLELLVSRLRKFMVSASLKYIKLREFTKKNHGFHIR